MIRNYLILVSLALISQNLMAAESWDRLDTTNIITSQGTVTYLDNKTAYKTFDNDGAKIFHIWVLYNYKQGQSQKILLNVDCSNHKEWFRNSTTYEKPFGKGSPIFIIPNDNPEKKSDLEPDRIGSYIYQKHCNPWWQIW